MAEVYDAYRQPHLVIPFVREYKSFQMPRLGYGYLAGEFPDGITTVEGVPAPATIRVLIRDRAGSDRDGAVVAEVKTSPSGTWKVGGLRADLRYDVICRHDGYNDMILSNVSPALATGLEFAGSFATIDDQVEILFGAGPYQVVVLGGTPPLGVTFGVVGDYVVATGNPGNWGQFTFTLRVIDSNGLSGSFESVMDVAEPLPTVIGVEFGGGYYIGDITIADGGEDDGVYAVIMGGPESQAYLAWKNPRSLTPGTESNTNSMANTLAMQANDPVTHYAGMHCLGYDGGGFDDWCMPARHVLSLAWNNRAALGALEMGARYYWSSTQSTGTIAWYQSFSSGTETTSSKTNSERVRPVRKLKRP